MRELDLLIAAVDGSYLRQRLAEYEATGDHRHGNGSLRPGAPCPGGDCWVARARATLAATEPADYVTTAQVPGLADYFKRRTDASRSFTEHPIGAVSFETMNEAAQLLRRADEALHMGYLMMARSLLSDAEKLVAAIVAGNKT